MTDTVKLVNARRRVSVSKYIDADKAIKDYAHYGIKHFYDATDLEAILNECPAADVVEVVRCKECKHADLFYPYCTIWEAAIDGDGYCYKGEKE